MIGINTISQASQMITDLLQFYVNEIDKAVRKAEDGAGVNISISLKMKPVNIMKPVNMQETDVEVGISFTTEKIKDSTSKVVNENQMELFDKIKKGEITVSVGKE